MSNTELKPCPFCGHTDTDIIPIFPSFGEDVRYIVTCRVCRSQTRKCLRIEEARQAWNRRESNGNEADN